MNGKNGFTGPRGFGEAKMAGESGSGRPARQPQAKRQVGGAEDQTEMEDRPDMQPQLGRQLRAIFEGIQEEPVPERFVRLLEALEAREKQR